MEMAIQLRKIIKIIKKKNMKKKITVIGLGYVGLPTLLLISETNKFKVIGYDNNKKILNDIKKGKTKINEKQVKIILKKNIKKKI